MGGVHHDHRPGRTWALSGGLALSPISTFFGLPWMVHLLGAWCLVPALSHPCLPWSGSLLPPLSPPPSTHPRLLPIRSIVSVSCHSIAPASVDWTLSLKLAAATDRAATATACARLLLAGRCCFPFFSLLGAPAAAAAHTTGPHLPPTPCPPCLCFVHSFPPTPPPRHPPIHSHTPHAPLPHIPSPYLAVHSLPVSISYFYFCPLFLSLAHRPSFFPPSTLLSPSSFPPAALVCDLFVIVVVFWKDKKENSKKRKTKIAHKAQKALAFS
ncbi:hypothetical protein CNYM01_10029 [Colletotrichum nymphaeae SA-01]|uniref:Uncharacterized protein n=1 Tax=Colletotrichum nymphaeae SA-01 TaxID=1460502 RepID=A0A135TP75_9PEZI|nr:hypothetical protein CNYM01_10029 [Colletotrichum nymphaeae SA-01]